MVIGASDVGGAACGTGGVAEGSIGVASGIDGAAGESGIDSVGSSSCCADTEGAGVGGAASGAE